MCVCDVDVLMLFCSCIYLFSCVSQPKFQIDAKKRAHNARRDARRQQREQQRDAQRRRHDGSQASTTPLHQPARAQRTPERTGATTTSATSDATLTLSSGGGSSSSSGGGSRPQQRRRSRLPQPKVFGDSVVSSVPDYADDDYDSLPPQPRREQQRNVDAVRVGV